MTLVSRVQKFHRLAPWILLLGAAWLLCLTAGVHAQESSYRILITNDDGIDSPGIAALAHELAKTAEILVVAPQDDLSGSSHSTKVLREKLRVTPYDKAGKRFGYAVNGTPADATRFGLLELSKDNKIDLVVSGINKGSNIGLVSHYSGTVGAAMEALVHGVPAIAVSQSRRSTDFTTAARFTAKFVQQLRRRGAPSGVVLSINVPAGKIKGVVAAPMGGSHIIIHGFAKLIDDTGQPYYAPKWQLVRVSEEGTDARAYQETFITITPLRFDWTDYKMLDELRQWDLSLD